MPYVQHKGIIDSRRVASAVQPFQIVALVGTTAEAEVIPIATLNVAPWGQVDASQPVAAAVTIYRKGNDLTAIAGASLGPNALLGVGSDNGALVPIMAASGSLKYAVGRSLEAAAAGERFTFHFDPEQLDAVT